MPKRPFVTARKAFFLTVDGWQRGGECGENILKRQVEVGRMEVSLSCLALIPSSKEFVRFVWNEGVLSFRLCASVF